MGQTGISEKHQQATLLLYHYILGTTIIRAFVQLASAIGIALRTFISEDLAEVCIDWLQRRLEVSTLLRFCPPAP